MNINLKQITKNILAFVVMIFTLLILAPKAHAQFAGTNGRILWTTPNSGQYTLKPVGSNVFSMNIATVSSYSGEWQAIYTPDGKYIIYVAKSSAPGSRSNLYIVDAARTITPVALTNFTTCDVSDPASNSDYSKVAFSCEVDATTSDIYALNLNISGNTITSSDQGKLTNMYTEKGSYNPVWAPDDSALYIRNGFHIYDLSVSPLNNVVEVFGSFDCFINQDFVLNDISPDGSKLLWIPIGGPNSNQLFTATVTMPTQTLTDLSGSTGDTYFGGYFSPDGTKIVATRYNNETGKELITGGVTGLAGLQVFSIDSNIGVESFRPFWSVDQSTYQSTPAVPNSSGSNTEVRPNWLYVGLAMFGVVAMLGSLYLVFKNGKTN